MDTKQDKSAKQCVNCPGATDHDTANCPVMKYGQLDPQQRVDVARGQPAPSVAGMDGWRWVPAVATLQMKNAGWQEIERQGIDPEDCEMQTIYCALLSAAPVPPVQCQVCEDTGTFPFDSPCPECQPPAQVDEREAFEAAVVKVATDSGYGFMAELLKRHADGSYRQSWVDAAWLVHQAWQRTQASPAPSADGGKVESDEVRRLREAIAGADDVLAALTACTNPLVRLERKYGKDWGRSIDSVRTELIAALSAHRGEGGAGMSTPLRIKALQDMEIAAAALAGEEFFMGLPDAWYEPTPTYGCNNGHVSRRYLKSEERGAICLECQEGVAMLPHHYDTDEKLKAALDEIRAKPSAGGDHEQ